MVALEDGILESTTKTSLKVSRKWPSILFSHDQWQVPPGALIHILLKVLIG